MYFSRKKLKPESGRSMVEMLGVLAVIGVLSIGGIYGYTTSMAKSKANTLLHEASLRATSVSIQMVNKKDPNISEFNTSGYGTFSTEVKNDLGQIAKHTDNYFVLSVSGVEKDVCKHAKLSAGVGTSIFAFYPEECVDNATVSLVYQKELKSSEAQCSSDADCGYCAHCNMSRCFPEPLCDNSCPPNKPVLSARGTCIECPTFFQDYTEFSADSEAECSKCTYEGIGYVFRNNACVLESCPPGFFYSYQASKCQSCDSGAYTHHQTHEENLECVEQCGGVRILTSDAGWGESCDKPCTGPGQFYDGWGQCITCGVQTSYWSSSGCNKCPGISFSLYDYYDHCVIDCPNNNFGDNVGRCCTEDEVYTDIGFRPRGHQYGACCPATRPVWNGSKCVPA